MERIASSPLAEITMQIMMMASTRQWMKTTSTLQIGRKTQQHSTQKNSQHHPTTGREEETKNGEGKQANAKDGQNKGGRGFYRPKEEKKEEKQNEDAPMSESGAKVSPKSENTAATHQQRGRRQENLEEGAKHKDFHRRRENDQEKEMLEEITMISLNIRGFNG